MGKDCKRRYSASHLATNTQAGLQKQRTIWQSKRSLRLHYHNWYQRAAKWIPEGQSVIEIGAGSGNFKDYYPDIIATDIFDQPWIDRVVSITELSECFDEATVDALVLNDVLHHVRDPVGFLKETCFLLRPRGRIIIIEPYVSRFLGKIVYGLLHHEDMCLDDDLTGQRPDETKTSEFSNEAIATLLFERRPDWLKLLKPLALLHKEYFSGLLYAASGGFNYRNILPFFVHRTLLPLENQIIRMAPHLFALRFLIVLEKENTTL